MAPDRGGAQCLCCLAPTSSSVQARWSDWRSIRAEQRSGGTKAKLNLSLGLIGIVTCRDLTRAAELGDATNQERRLVP